MFYYTLLFTDVSVPSSTIIRALHKKTNKIKQTVTQNE